MVRNHEATNKQKRHDIWRVKESKIPLDLLNNINDPDRLNGAGYPALKSGER